MTYLLWLGFIVLIVAALAFDLLVAHRTPHKISTREALGWTAFWVFLSLLFNAAVYFMYEHHWLGIGSGPHGLGQPVSGRRAALDFFTGYLIEKSLSLDNIFVIALIFAAFRVAPRFQHRVLFWGVLGAMVMRGLMIVAGVSLIQRFEWATYAFGALLILSAVKMLRAGDEEVDPERQWVIRLARRWLPVAPAREDSDRFFTRVNGRRAVTPLFLVLLVVEATDLAFAVDSIPAIIAVTTDSFIVFTSNIFAILGLRSLYFALAAMMDRFRYLKVSLVFLLAFVGVKMLLTHSPYKIDTEVSLVVIVGILTVGVLASAARGRGGGGGEEVEEEV